jgi:hypothetical protein
MWCIDLRGRLYGSAEIYQFCVVCGVTQHPIAARCASAHGVWPAGFRAANAGGEGKKFGGGEEKSLKNRCI